MDKIRGYALRWWFFRKDIYCNNIIEKFKELDERLTKLGINEVRVHLIGN